ncbi:phosphopantetheine-binding protein [Streptomyces sp. MN03-5084-2B]|nr:phosphopantetheine-binding protein [Streptomyces sp. MN03-5084-2B]
MTDFAPVLDAELVPTVISRLVYLVAPIKADDVGPQSRLVNDLGFHSLALAELGFTVEDLFTIDTLPPERTMSLQTIQDIITLTTEELADGGATLPSVAHLQSIFSRFGGEWPAAA